MPNSLSIPLVNTETISIYKCSFYYTIMVRPKYPVVFQYLYCYKMKASRLKCLSKKDLLCSLTLILHIRKPKLNNFSKTIFETEHQEALSDCIIMRLNHEKCKALMKVFIFIILSPPAVTSFMITLLLILSGPEFHKKYKICFLIFLPILLLG